MLID
jgi:hypothetical protein